MRTSVHPFSDVSLLRPEGELLDVLRKGVDLSLIHISEPTRRS